MILAEKNDSTDERQRYYQKTLCYNSSNDADECITKIEGGPNMKVGYSFYFA